MEKPRYLIGERVDKLCPICQEERGHIVASVNKRGQISRVECPKCLTRSTFKVGAALSTHPSDIRTGALYDRKRTYRTGQTMMHPVYGLGEVTSVIEPQKIDVLFSDRVRRLIHSRV